MPPAHPWYLTFRPVDRPRLTLYCLPGAGGGPSVFRAWAEALPGWIEVRAVRLPGRPGRHRERPFTDADEAAEALLAGLGLGQAEAATPYAFFGHSMGALLALRMTRELHRRGAVAPRLLAVASWPPDGAVPGTTPDPALDDAQFVPALRGLGGFAQVLDDPGMLRHALPLLRADFGLCRSYSRRPGAPMPVPVIAFCGDADSVTPAPALLEWRRETTDFLGLHLFPGGHFFLDDHVEELTALIAGAASAER